MKPEALQRLALFLFTIGAASAKPMEPIKPTESTPARHAPSSSAQPTTTSSSARVPLPPPIQQAPPQPSARRYSTTQGQPVPQPRLPPQQPSMPPSYYDQRSSQMPARQDSASSRTARAPPLEYPQQSRAPAYGQPSPQSLSMGTPQRQTSVRGNLPPVDNRSAVPPQTSMYPQQSASSRHSVSQAPPPPQQGNLQGLPPTARLDPRRPMTQQTPTYAPQPMISRPRPDQNPQTQISHPGQPQSQYLRTTTDSRLRPPPQAPSSQRPMTPDRLSDEIEFPGLPSSSHPSSQRPIPSMQDPRIPSLQMQQYQPPHPSQPTAQDQRPLGQRIGEEMSAQHRQQYGAPPNPYTQPTLRRTNETRRIGNRDQTGPTLAPQRQVEQSSSDSTLSQPEDKTDRHNRPLYKPETTEDDLRQNRRGHFLGPNHQPERTLTKYGVRQAEKDRANEERARGSLTRTVKDAGSAVQNRILGSSTLDRGMEGLANATEPIVKVGDAVGRGRDKLKDAATEYVPGVAQTRQHLDQNPLQKAALKATGRAALAGVADGDVTDSPAHMLKPAVRTAATHSIAGLAGVEPSQVEKIDKLQQGGRKFAQAFGDGSRADMMKHGQGLLETAAPIPGPDPRSVHGLVMQATGEAKDVLGTVSRRAERKDAEEEKRRTDALAQQRSSSQAQDPNDSRSRLSRYSGRQIPSRRQQQPYQPQSQYGPPPPRSGYDQYPTQPPPQQRMLDAPPTSYSNPYAPLGQMNPYQDALSPPRPRRDSTADPEFALSSRSRQPPPEDPPRRDDPYPDMYGRN